MSGTLRRVAPETPVLVTDAVATRGWIEDLALAGEYIIATDAFGAVHVYSSTSTGLVAVAEVVLSSSISGLMVSDTVGYVASWDGVTPIDLSNAYSPVVALSMAWQVKLLQPPLDMAVYSNTLAIAAARDGVGILDVSVPLTPTESVWITTTSAVRSVEWLSGTLFVGEEGGLLSAFVYDGAQLQMTDSLELADAVWDLVPCDGFLCVVMGLTGLTVVDVSDRSDIKLVGLLEPAEDTFWDAHGSAAMVGSDTMLIPTIGSGILQVDLSVASAPTVTGTIGDSLYSLDLLSVSESVFSALGNEVLEYDVTHPSAITLKAVLWFEG